MNLVPFGQRGQPSVGRQDADLSAGAAGQVAAARFIFVLRIQVPAPHLAVLIQRHQLTIRGESTVDDGDTVPRENRGAVFQQVLVVVPLKAAQIGLHGRRQVTSLFAVGLAVGNVFRQQDAELLGRGAIVAPDKRGESHIGRVQQLAARFLGGSSQPLGRLGLGQASLNFGLLGFDDGEGACRLLLRLLCSRRVLVGLLLVLSGRDRQRDWPAGWRTARRRRPGPRSPPRGEARDHHAEPAGRALLLLQPQLLGLGQLPGLFQLALPGRFAGLLFGDARPAGSPPETPSPSSKPAR